MKKAGKIITLILVVITIFCAFGIISGTASDADLVVPYVAAKNAENGIYITWTMDFDAEAYNVYRKTGSGSAVKIGQTPSYASFFTDTKAVSGKNYTYYVLPCVGATEGSCETQVQIDYLAQPENVAVKSATTGVKVTWTKSSGATKYNIYRKLPSDSAWSHAGFVGDVDSFTDTTVESGKTYLYSVRARNTATVSSYDENGVSVDYLQAPELLSLTSISDGLYLKWEAVPEADQYIIYRRTAGKTWQTLTTVEPTVLRYIDTTVEPGKGYAYTVCAVDGELVSGYHSGLAYKFIPAVNVTSVKNDPDGLEVKWDVSPYATGYKIYRKAEGADSWTAAGTVKGKSTDTFVDKKVSNSEKYTYTVIVVSEKSQSTYDNTGKSATYIAAPKNVTVAKSGNSNVITWTKVTDGTNYYVYRRIEGTIKWTYLSKTGKTATYTDSGIDVAQIYEYSVKTAVLTNGAEAFSAYSKPAKSLDIDPNRKMVALTYDDGPSNSVTNRVLDVLEEYDAKATFFVIGSNIYYNSEPMVRAYKMGCEIANHTYTHINLPSYSDATVTSEITKTSELIKEYTGEYPKVFRAPGGATDSRVCELIGMPIIYWSVDTRDWEHRTASTTVSYIKEYTQDGSIILMHDIYDETASASETAISWLIDQGYQLVTVSQLMEYRGIKMQNGVTYYDAYPE